MCPGQGLADVSYRDWQPPFSNLADATERLGVCGKGRAGAKCGNRIPGRGVGYIPSPSFQHTPGADRGAIMKFSD